MEKIFGFSHCPWKCFQVVAGVPFNLHRYEIVDGAESGGDDADLALPLDPDPEWCFHYVSWE